MRTGRRRRLALVALGVTTAAALTGCVVVGPRAEPTAADPTASGTAPTTASPSGSPRSTTAPSPSPTPEPTPTRTPEMLDVEPQYRATISEIDDRLREAMVPTVWREGCPTPLEDLRALRMSYLDFDGQVQVGRMVVHEDVAEQVVRIFERLFELGYRIRQMVPMEELDGDVHKGLAADNTSSFNCRTTLLGEIWSEHAHGKAIDVNPLENPYWHPASGYVNPDAGMEFVDRPDHHAVIQDGDEVVQAFAAEGWLWGGDWTRTIDWMHFSPSGR